MMAHPVDRRRSGQPPHTADQQHQASTGRALRGELTSDQIEDVLRSEMVGRIGCHADGRTYVVPITYVYDGESVIAHSDEGLKLRMMRENPEVCFEVDRYDEVRDLLEWRSVVAWGCFEEVEGEEARAVMEAFLQALLPRVFRVRLMSRVFRIRLREKTGRFEK